MSQGRPLQTGRVLSSASIILSCGWGEFTVNFYIYVSLYICRRKILYPVNIVYVAYLVPRPSLTAFFAAVETLFSMAAKKGREGRPGYEATCSSLKLMHNVHVRNA